MMPSSPCPSARSVRSLESDTRFGFIDQSIVSNRVENPRLFANGPATTMRSAIVQELLAASSFTFSVAFVTNGGIGAIKEELLHYAGKGTIITSDYQDFNDPTALRELLHLDGVDVRILSGYAHHAKGYVFEHGDHLTAVIGSSNLTHDALTRNEEWNLRFSTHRDGDIADQLHQALRRQIEQSEPLTESWIRDYEARRRPPVIVQDSFNQPVALHSTGAEILPNKMQTQALEHLQRFIDRGETRALIISATGTGKTILAALAARSFEPKRVLFIAHTAHILRKAAEEFVRVFNTNTNADDAGFFTGGERDLDARFVFATIQSLSRPEHLFTISPKQFDYIIITVDIFNEGIDIPSVNVVMMLRSTKSPVIFTQQLGRGLRKAPGKETLRVIDVIGNYANNYLIPIALTGDRSGDKDGARETLRRSRLHPIAGASTISFDGVSTQRILESLQKVTLIDKRRCKEAVLNLRYRLGRMPRLIDFETHESINPYLMASRFKNYWSLLHSLKLVEIGPRQHEYGYLPLLSSEILNGKRPQELLLIQQLLAKSAVTHREFAADLAARGLNHSDQCLSTVERVLNLDWFPERQRTAFGGRPLVVSKGATFVLDEEFERLYRSYSPTSSGYSPSNFRDHIDDLVETGLLLNRKQYEGQDQFIRGKNTRAAIRAGFSTGRKTTNPRCTGIRQTLTQ